MAVLLVLGLFVLPLSAQEVQPLPKVPPGFQIIRAAGVPEIKFPMFACFDDQGRLYVAESSGLDLYRELQQLTRKCRISRLEDKDGDGRFETISVFADKLVFPMGLAWRDGRLYVADPPHVITLEDMDQDGRADRRKNILGNFGHLDNGSLHGLTFGPDGWLYLTMGMPDGYQFTNQFGLRVEGKSGALIRCRPDGSRPEVVCRGFDNLVEVVFLPDGRIVGTDNWFQFPSDGIRDALVHLIEGGLYPRTPDEGTVQFQSGKLLPAIATFPAVALSGLEIYRGAATEFRGQLFAAEHNSRKVSRHLLQPEGDSYRAHHFDFVTSSDPDFHPSDVLEDEDGSLLVIDTGGWYVEHCPTGKIRDSKAPGGIFRVTKRGAEKISDPWGTKLSWTNLVPDELSQRMTDPRAAVRKRATEAAIAGRNFSLLEQLSRQSNSILVTEAIWGLMQLGGSRAVDRLRGLVREGSPEIKQAAARALSRLAAPQAAPELALLCRSTNVALRLAGAEALVWCGSSNSVSLLGDLLQNTPTNLPFLEHALLHGIHRWAGEEILNLWMKRSSPRLEAAALALLDQPPHRKLTAAAVLSRTISPHESVSQAALRSLRGHPEWAAEAALVLSAWLEEPKAAAVSGTVETFLAFQKDSKVQQIISHGLSRDDLPRLWKERLLEVVEKSSVRPMPMDWVKALEKLLVDPGWEKSALKTAATSKAPVNEALLTLLAEGANRPVNIRLEAIRLLLRKPRVASDSILQFLLEQGSDAAPPLARMTARELFPRLLWTDQQFERFLQWAAGQKGNADFILAVAGARADLAQRSGWVRQLRSLVELHSVSYAAMEGFARKLPEADRAWWQERMEKQRSGQLQSLKEAQKFLQGGDAKRGQKVFFESAASCATCHQALGQGGKFGPDLTRVGAIRSGGDLLESLLFPSSTFAQGYETWRIQTTDGEDRLGLVMERGAESLVFREGPATEVRLQSGEIREMNREPLSLMPEGLSEVLSPEQWRDLLAFLQSLK